MLLGEYEHTIDDKNRLTLPAKFRESFAEGIVVTRGLDGCLYAYRRPDWGRLVDSQLATLDPLSQEGRRLHRFFFSGAAEAELDKQGRLVIAKVYAPHRLRQMHLPALPPFFHPVPIKNPIRRVAVFLDLHQHGPGAERVHPAARQKNPVTGGRLDRVQSFLHAAVLQRA